MRWCRHLRRCADLSRCKHLWTDSNVPKPHVLGVSDVCWQHYMLHGNLPADNDLLQHFDLRDVRNVRQIEHMFGLCDLQGYNDLRTATHLSWDNLLLGPDMRGYGDLR